MILFFGFGIWFWVLVTLEIIFLTWFVEECWPLPSILSVALFIVLLWWLADVPIWTWIRDNPIQLAMYCLYYVLAGIAWSVGKYWFLLLKLRKEISRFKKKWLKDMDKFTAKYKDAVGDKPDFVSFEDYLRNHVPVYESAFDSTAKKLVFWAMFWPTSFIWTIINQPVRKLFKFLIKDVFIGIYRKMYKVMIEDLIKTDIPYKER